MIHATLVLPLILTLPLLGGCGGGGGGPPTPPTPQADALTDPVDSAPAGNSGLPTAHDLLEAGDRYVVVPPGTTVWVDMLDEMWAVLTSANGVGGWSCNAYQQGGSVYQTNETIRFGYPYDVDTMNHSQTPPVADHVWAYFNTPLGYKDVGLFPTPLYVGWYHSVNASFPGVFRAAILETHTGDAEMIIVISATQFLHVTQEIGGLAVHDYRF